MKIAIVAQGRFHAFDLAKALLHRGHAVTVFTNYPAWAARKFGLPSSSVRGYWIQGVLYRILYKFSNSGLRFDTSKFLNPLFGRWAAAQIAKEAYDVVHSFSGIAVELLAARTRRPGHLGHPIHLVVRGSAHIAVQNAILLEEEIRSNQKLERPSETIMEREETEYRSADRIITLSRFAYNSFLDRGIDREKIALLPLGVNVSDFRCSQEVSDERRRRIVSGAPLRVLWVGTMSLQKGALDYLDIVKALRGQNFEFRFVGDVPKNMQAMADEIKDTVKFIPRQRQWDLRRQYDWADVFIFPTIQDGFAVVLAQANANGLPLISTTNCAGPDFIRENSTGWVVPIRSPRAFADRLRWCDENRDAVADMVRRISEEFVPRTWDDVALDFEKICHNTIQLLHAEHR